MAALASEWCPKEGEIVETRWKDTGKFTTTRTTHRANLGVKIGGILHWYEVADLKPTVSRASSASVEPLEGFCLSHSSDAPIPPSGALNAIGDEALQQSGAGWYAWRWWASAELHIYHDNDYPYFGGNDGGAHDLFGPFDSEADGRECGVVMGTASRPLFRPQQLPHLALPAPAPVAGLLPAWCASSIQRIEVLRIPDGMYGEEFVAEALTAETETFVDRAMRIVSEAEFADNRVDGILEGVQACVEAQPAAERESYRERLMSVINAIWLDVPEKVA